MSLVDKDLKNDTTDEVIAGIDREVMNNFGVGAMFIYRKYSGFNTDQRYKDFSSEYAGPIPFTAACGNATCGASSYSGFYYQRAPTRTAIRLDDNTS